MAAVVLVASGGCGAGEATPGEATLAIYVSAPLSGPGRADGRDAADGARLALAEADGEAAGFAVEATYLDVARGSDDAFSPVSAAANARRAAEDSTTIAYVGELESEATRSSLPITNSAGILQVAPGSGAEDLVRDEETGRDVPATVQNTGDRTFAQLVPTHAVGAQPRLPRSSPDFVAAFRARHGRAPGSFAALGHEAMASVLDAVERAGDPSDRASVIEAYLGGPVRDSAIGRYRVTDTGELAPQPG